MSKQSRTRGIKHILSKNRISRARDPKLANLHYDIVDGKNIQVCTDGFRVAILQEDYFVDIKHYDIPTCGEYPDFWKQIDRAVKNTDISNVALIELPDLKELKSWYEYHKAMKSIILRPIYYLGKNLPCVNAEYLIDAMEIVDLKTAKAFRVNFKNSDFVVMDKYGNYVYMLGVIPINPVDSATNLSERYVIRNDKILKVDKSELENL